MYYTYVLKSRVDNKFYVGCTNDLKDRIRRHTDGLVQSTKLRRPLKLVYFEACISEEKAYKREKYFKSGFGRSFLKDRI